MNKQPNLLKLALKNMRSYGWMNFKMCFTFACLAFLICLFTIYNGALNLRRDNYSREILSSNYFTSQYKSSYNNFIAELDELEGIERAEDVYYLHNYSAHIKKCFGWGGYDVSTAYITMYLGGEPIDAYEKVVLDSICDPNNDYFHGNDLISMEQLYGYDSLFLMGGEPQAADEIAIGEHVVKAYKLEPEDFLGKHIAVYMNNQLGGEPIFEFEGTVSGIIREEYYSLPGHGKNNDCSPVILFHSDSPFFKSSYITEYRAYLSDWPDADLAVEWQERYPGAYRGWSRIGQIGSLTKVQILAKNLYIVIGSTLIVSLILTIFLMIDKYMKVFARFGGILLSSGMRRSRMYGLLIVQILVICVISIPIALILTMAGYYIINALTFYVTRISLGMSTGHIIGMMFAGSAIVTFIAVLFFLYMILKLRKKSVKELMQITVD